MSSVFLNNFIILSTFCLFFTLILNYIIKEQYLSLRSGLLKACSLILIGIPFINFFSPEKVIEKTINLETLHNINSAPKNSSFFYNNFEVIFWVATALLIIKVSIVYILFIKKLKKLQDYPPLIQNHHFSYIKLSSEYSTPFVAGFFKSYLILPKSLLTEDEKVIKSVLEHEASHIKNNDHKMALILSFLNCVYYWNPLYWIYRRNFLQLQESIADSEVLKTIRPKIYAKILLKLSTPSGAEPGQTAKAMASSQIYTRIKKVIKQGKYMKQKPPKRTVLIWIMVFTTGCLAALSQTTNKEKIVHINEDSKTVITTGADEKTKKQTDVKKFDHSIAKGMSCVACHHEPAKPEKLIIPDLFDHSKVINMDCRKCHK